MQEWVIKNLFCFLSEASTPIASLTKEKAALLTRIPLAVGHDAAEALCGKDDVLDEAQLTMAALKTSIADYDDSSIAALKASIATYNETQLTIEIKLFDQRLSEALAPIALLTKEKVPLLTRILSALSHKTAEALRGKDDVLDEAQLTMAVLKASIAEYDNSSIAVLKASIAN